MDNGRSVSGEDQLAEPRDDGFLIHEMVQEVGLVVDPLLQQKFPNFLGVLPRDLHHALLKILAVFDILSV